MSNSLHDFLKIASFKPESLKEPDAWCGHIPFAAWLMKTLQPDTFVELGTHTGNSYFAFCQAAKEAELNTKCFAVDTWAGDEHAGFYDDFIFPDVFNHNQSNYAEFSSLLRMTFDEALAKFDDGSIDLLHIDGLHTYEAVKHDFESWLPKLRRGAVVLFHDTQVRDRGFGVWRLWEELKQEYPNHIEFEHSHGLGVLSVEKTNPLDLFDDFAGESAEKYKSFFSAIALKNSMTLRLAGLDRQKADLDRQLADRDKQLADREKMITSLSGRVAALESSLSWRMTAPLRKGCDVYYGLQHAWRNASSYVRRNGVLKTLPHAWTIMRRHGLNAFRTTGNVVVHDDGRNDYAEWIRRYDTVDDTIRIRIRAKVSEMPKSPLISVVMPTYNSNPVWLREAIESVRNQLYPHWELCIADDASTDGTTKQILAEYEKLDGRIKVVYRENNGHICAASNSALALASGEWIALLDHDDVLREDALYWVAREINEHPNAALIYSDEDKLNDAGGRYSPYFKPDWSVDLFYSHNLITHLGVYRKDVIDLIGGFREGFEGAQDYDLALRVIEYLSSGQIRHIPRILYHWRAHDASTADHTADAKPYAMLAGERALNDHFERTGKKGRVKFVGYGYRAQYEIMEPYPHVTIIIPVHNGYKVFRKCIESIRRQTGYRHYDVLVVDNRSSEKPLLEYLERLGSYPDVTIIRDDGPFNYSAINNRAASVARGEFIVLLNSDVEVISGDWLHEMVSFGIQPGVGAVGARLWYPNDTLQHGGIVLGIGGVAGHSHKGFHQGDHGYLGRASLIHTCSAVTGACALFRRDLFLSLGGLNERDLGVAFNDVDICLRLSEAGYRTVWTPYAELYHHESISRGYENTPEKKKRFEREVVYMKARWGDLLSSDPAYNPNLTLEQEDFSLAWPPRVDGFGLS
jgi:O-antigen biosynthesis protein